MKPQLTLQGINKSYGSAHVLQAVDLAIPAGSRTAIVGPSGSGKTTLLRIIAGFEFPDSGQLTFDGKVLANGSEAVPAHLRGIGFVPQEGALFPHMSVADNIGFGLPRSTANRQARLLELMDMVALDAVLLQSRPHEISGGQQQRVAIARALAQSPKLMLLDEPFSALDTGLRAATRKGVAALLSKAGITTILVTHDQAEALSFADQVAVMRKGKLVQVGSPRTVYQQPVDADTAQFLGPAIILNATLEAGWAHCALGKLPVDDNTLSGSAQIMLRPEQFSVVEAAQRGADAGGVFGVVTQMDFWGHISELQIQIEGADLSILLDTPSSHAIAQGSRVHVTLQGTAHVLR